VNAPEARELKHQDRHYPSVPMYVIARALYVIFRSL
jgi:hypothetical protein